MKDLFQFFGELGRVDSQYLDNISISPYLSRPSDILQLLRLKSRNLEP